MVGKEAGANHESCEIVLSKTVKSALFWMLRCFSHSWYSPYKTPCSIPYRASNCNCQLKTDRISVSDQHKENWTVRHNCQSILSDRLGSCFLSGSFFVGSAVYYGFSSRNFFRLSLKSPSILPTLKST